MTVKLPPVVVEGARERPGGRLADFERRRAGKMGYFITRQDIDKLNASYLADVLGTVRGITLECTGGVCIARMTRAQPGCEPQYFIDGVESTPYFARNTPPHDVLGLEVYRGPSEVPAEFTGSNSCCGVIVIWTKSSP
ncbi:MAG TPA: Plug domain-containing protein [Gemmatimonadales bacterium]|nr:Plug domain-containing protein [Gemmatimonadales bacterium]